MCNEFEKQAEFYGIPIVDFEFPSKIRGAYHNGVIGINKDIQDAAERRCIIACEMGRHLVRKNKSIILTEEQEQVAAFYWAVNYLMPLSAFVQAKRLGICAADFACYLRVTPQFVKTGIEFYKNSSKNRSKYLLQEVKLMISKKILKQGAQSPGNFIQNKL